MLKEHGALPNKDDASQGYKDLYESRASVEILFRACRRPGEITKVFFPTPSAIAEQLTVDEIGVMFNQYLIVCSEIGPIVSKMSQGEYDAWIDRLVEGGAANTMAFFSVAARIDLVMYLASRLSALRTDKPSAGSQPEATS
jgi:hypothetical protein